MISGSERKTQRRVLVCEDDPVQNKFFVAALKQAGYEAKAARNPGEALAEIGKKRVDAVVADVQLDRGTAFDLVSVLRRVGLNAPVIMVSAYATPSMRERAAAAGATMFLEKPFPAKDLVGAVRHVVSTQETPNLGIRVLLAEDRSDASAPLAQGLRETGFDVLCAKNGAEAERQIHGAAPPVDIVVADMHLPDLQGAALIRKLLQADPGAYVVMCTGEASAEEIREGYEAGAATLVRKPIEPRDLAEHLKRHASLAREARRRADRARREEAQPWHRRFLRWLRRYASAPRGTSRNNRFMTITIGTVVIAVGAVAAFFTEATIASVDEYKAETARYLKAAERKLESAPDRGRFERWYMLERLQMERQANDYTQRYYQSQIDLQRMRGFSR